MSRTKIDWADHVWNPVWGCRFNCPYCYARKIAKRFGKTDAERNFELCERPEAWDMMFPKGSAVFVNSMSDVSCWRGNWINNANLMSIIGVTYIWLTKDYGYDDVRLRSDEKIQSYLGYTVTTNRDIERLKAAHPVFADHQFINIEPLLEPLKAESIAFLATAPAVIIGAETGNRKGKADLQDIAGCIYDVVMLLDSPQKVFVKDPAFSELVDYYGFDCPEHAAILRQLLWSTRKAVV